MTFGFFRWTVFHIEGMPFSDRYPIQIWHALSIILKRLFCIPFLGTIFNATRLFMKISKSYFDVFSLFILKYRSVCMTQANFDTNNNLDICSISLKFHMWMYDRIFTSVEYFLYKLYWKRRVFHDSMTSIAMQISIGPPISFC